MIQTEQKIWSKEKGWEHMGTNKLGTLAPQIVFGFGARLLVEDPHMYQQVRNFYPGAYIVLCSTAGEILGDEVHDGTVVVTAAHFEKSVVRFAETTIHTPDDSLSAGRRLAEFLPVEGLVHAMVFSDGLAVNGSSLVRGINDNLPANVTVTGGLVADGADFRRTAVGRDAAAAPHRVVLLGFYGEALRVGYGSYGGWEPMQEIHTITSSSGNVLYELDGKPALDVYRGKLGDRVKELPGSALLYPLRLHLGEGKHDVVRTILGIEPEEKSMTFAGDMPQGVKAEFMRADMENLVHGASLAAKESMRGVSAISPDLAILVSCVGRKLVMGARVSEEIRAVRTMLGDRTAIAGFYSYGELCPASAEDRSCLMHNQTMTITTMREQ